MIADVRTVMWKEWKEFLHQSGGRRGTIAGMALLVGFLGIVSPWQLGREFIESPLVLFLAWGSLFAVMSVIADSFAGERERHTLETLLASRLPDRAILFGKVAAAVSYGWGFTLAILLLGLVTVNAVHGHGDLLLYRPAVGLGSLGLSLVGTTLAAGAGVLVSLRASTVRQAQQMLSFGFMLLVFVPTLGAQALPAAWQARVADAARDAGLRTVLIVAVASLTALDIALLAAAVARFRRARLILE